MPKKTLEAVLARDNDYLVAVKANQPRLYRQVQAIAAYSQPLAPAFTTQDNQRGRQERRQLRIFSADGLDPQQWPAVKTVLLVERQSTRRGKPCTSQAYYISSLRTSANQWMQMIRGHWSIENGLHWPKDVVLKEDDTAGQNANALLNASLFRSILINLVRLNGWQSLTTALRELANQVHLIFSLLQ